MTGVHGDRAPYRYRIRVRGRLGETLRSAFPALQAKASGGDTVLSRQPARIRVPGQRQRRQPQPRQMTGYTRAPR